MTGYIDLANPDDAWFSYTSIMALEDLGYDIAYQDYAYDNYVVPDYGAMIS